MKRLAYAALCVAALAQPARAQLTSFNFDYYCSMGSFQVCASVRLSSVGSLLTMQVWNLNGTMGVPYTLTDIGLYYSGAAWSGTVNSYAVNYVTGSGSTNITNYWTSKGAQDINNLAGVKVELKEGNNGNSGIVGCTQPGGLVKWATCFDGQSSFDGKPYVEFTFNLSQRFALENVQMRFHAQQLPNGGSIKCDTGGAGDYPDCVANPPAVVPEPATLILTGTGLFGLVGAERRRRKKARGAS